MLTDDSSMQKTALIGSGGLDSVCLAYRLAAKGKLAMFISFDYGQRHKKELHFARQCANALGVPFFLADISTIGGQLTGSALTDKNIAVPDGHYAEASMKQTIVPNRNAIFLAIAFGIAAAHEFDSVAIAVHSGDHFVYPDCREDFLTLFNQMEAKSLEGAVRLYAPYVDKNKAAIVADGVKYNVPFVATWSCYKGGEIHCGRCGTCVERREAFYLAGAADPTAYADPDFWLSCIESRQPA